MSEALRTTGRTGLLTTSRARVALALATALGACSTIGSPPGRPDGLPHGGVGPFRLLASDETGERPTPRGAFVRPPANVAIAHPTLCDGYLFYTRAPIISMPGGGDPTVPPGLVDWSIFEPRVLYRSPPGEGLAHDAGSEVLRAGAPWEGGYVSDPSCVVLPDGRARLYYVAAGGVGVAEAPSVDGAFTRVGSAPVLGDEGGATPSHVTVVAGDGLGGGFFAYYALGPRIHAARSDDGLSWTPLGPLELAPLPARDERDSVEVSVAGPGALVVRTAAERSVVRLYYESRREDGQRILTMAGSFDGVTFESLGRPVVTDDTTLSTPFPVQLDARITLLYSTSPRGAAGYQLGALVVSIAPGGVRLAPEMMPMP